MGTPLSSVGQNDLPVECASINFTTTARPVMFNLRDGVSLGIFAPQATFKTGEAVVLAIWVSNSTDDERELESCSDVQWWTLDLDVYDSQWQRRQSRSEKQSGNPVFEEMRFAVEISPFAFHHTVVVSCVTTDTMSRLISVHVMNYRLDVTSSHRNDWHSHCADYRSL